MKLKKKMASAILIIYVGMIILPIIMQGIGQFGGTSSVGTAVNYLIYPEGKIEQGLDVLTKLSINSINPTSATANISMDIKSESDKELRVLQLRTDRTNEVIDADKILGLDKFFAKLHKDESRYLMFADVEPSEEAGVWDLIKLYSPSLSEKMINLQSSPVVLGHYNYTVENIDVELEGNGLYYPFDTYKGTIVLNFDPQKMYSTKYYTHIELKNLDSNMRFEVNPEKWRRDINLKEEYEKQNYVQIYLRRNNFIRYYVPISILMAYISIVLYMLLVKFDSLKELGIITVAVVTLLFTTRGVSIPDNVPSFNILDTIHMIMFLAFLVIALIKGIRLTKN